MGTLINVLIRTSNRPKAFERCINSVFAQTYQHVRIIVAFDNYNAIDYINKHRTGRRNVDILRVVRNTNWPYHWNFYCNHLKEQVKAGWFFYLDDDDVLDNVNALHKLADIIEDSNVKHPLIVQFDRCGIIKPSNLYIEDGKIERGKIGMPCIVMHESHKKLASFDGNKGADYRFIKAMSELVKFNFNKLVLVRCDNKGLLGQMES